MQTQLKTLDFQGSPIYYIQGADGVNWVLIRPLCDALGVHADKQLEGIKEDDILRDEHAVQRVHLPGDDKHRQWSCLPERFIYGWLFGIKETNTMKPDTKANLTAYKRGCYDALYDHFHGRIKAALDLEKEQALVALELDAVEKRLHAKVQDDPDYHRKVELQAKQKLLRKAETQSRQHSKQQAFEFAAGVLEPAEA
jgi:hypothetical protein